MTQDNAIRVRHAPWGRKKFYAPLPILSVLLVAAAVAAPSALLHTTFTFFDDGHLTISATVQALVHASGPTGKLVGFMTVTNAYAFAIEISAASAVITSGTISGSTFTADAQPVVLSVPLRVPLVVPAGATVKQQFSGDFSGSVLGLTPASSFEIAPSVSWVEVHSPPQTVGPFTYSTVKFCPTPFTLSSSADANYWNDACFT